MLIKLRLRSCLEIRMQYEFTVLRLMVVSLKGSSPIFWNNLNAEKLSSGRNEGQVEVKECLLFVPLWCSIHKDN
jgi:hypothetical protein